MSYSECFETRHLGTGHSKLRISLGEKFKDGL